MATKPRAVPVSADSGDAVVLAVVNDVHAGSTVAVCPPQIQLDDGGYYGASKAQLWLWDCWQRFWQEVDDTRKAENAKLYMAFNGDMVDGDHHQTTQIMSGNLTAQAQAFNACMRVPLNLEPDAIAFIRGTEAHVGKSASAEERIADGLRRDGRPVYGDPDTGTSSWWHCRWEIQGILFDIAHHGRTGQREHTRASAASLHAHDILMSHVKSGDRPPNLCLRAHYHRFNDSYDAAKITRVITGGAWQLKTGYVHAKHADSLADIGGLIIVIRNGKYEVRKVHYEAARGAVLRVAA